MAKSYFLESIYNTLNGVVYALNNDLIPSHPFVPSSQLIIKAVSDTLLLLG